MITEINNICLSAMSESSLNHTTFSLEIQVDTLPLEVHIISSVTSEFCEKEKVDSKYDEVLVKSKNEKIKCYRCEQTGHYAYRCLAKRIRYTKGKKKGKDNLSYSVSSLDS